MSEESNSPPLSKRQRLVVPSATPLLIDSNITPNTFMWIVWDFHEWPAGDGFEIDTPEFVLGSSKTDWQLKMTYNGTCIELSLLLMSSDVHILNTHVRVTVLGFEFKPLLSQSRNYTFRSQRRVCNFSNFVALHNVLDEDKKMLLDGDLLLLWEITVLDFQSQYYQKPAGEVSRLIVDMQALFVRDTYADFAIEVENQKFLCHKSVLACRSEFFKSMLKYDMKEKKENKVVLKDITPGVFEKLLSYIYTGKICILESEVFQLYVAADKYRLERLQALCESSLNSFLCEENAMEIYKFAIAYDVRRLKQRAERIIQGFKKQLGGWHYYKNMIASQLPNHRTVSSVSSQGTHMGHPVTPNADEIYQGSGMPCFSSPLESDDSDVAILDSCHDGSTNLERGEDNDVSVMFVSEGDHISRGINTENHTIEKATSTEDKEFLGEASDEEGLDVMESKIEAENSDAKGIEFDPMLQKEHCVPLREIAHKTFPPSADLWCCTKIYMLGKTRWKIKGLSKYYGGKNLGIKSLEFYSEDKEKKIQSTWQIEVNLMERRNLLGCAPTKYLSVFLTCTSSNVPINQMEYKLAVLTRSYKEKHIVNGSHKFQLNVPHAAAQYYIKIDEIMSDRILLHNGEDLILTCKLMIRKSSLFDSIEPTIIPVCDLGQNLAELLESGLDADLMIKAKDGDIKCHKAILACRSPYFMSIFRKMKFDNPEGHVLEILDVPSNLMRTVVTYLYTGKCPDVDPAALYPLANRFHLPDFKVILEDMLVASLTVENVARMVLYAEQHTSQLLRKHCLQFIAMYLKEVMDTPGWKDIVKNESLYNECLNTPILSECFTNSEITWFRSH